MPPKQYNLKKLENAVVSENSEAQRSMTLLRRDLNQLVKDLGYREDVGDKAGMKVVEKQMNECNTRIDGCEKRIKHLERYEFTLRNKPSVREVEDILVREEDWIMPYAF